MSLDNLADISTIHDLRDQLAERERALARVADDARAALSETTYATLEHEHTVMRNALYAVMQATHGKPSLAHLYDLADNMLPPDAPRFGKGRDDRHGDDV